MQYLVRPWVQSLFGRFSGGLNAIGSLWIFALMLLINADVLGRFALSRPISGVPEMVTISVVGIIYLQIGHSLRAGRFVRSDSVLNAVSRRWPRAAHLLNLLFSLAGCGLMLVLLYGAIPRLIRAWEADHFIGNQGVFTAPLWPIWLCIVIGCTVSAVQYLIFASEDAGSTWRDDRPLPGGAP